MLEPTIIYVNQVLGLKSLGLKGAAHITGGGLLENVPRVLPKGLGVQISLQSWQIPDLYKWLQKEGNIQQEEMFRTFNMGIGMVCIVENELVEQITSQYEDAVVLGQVVDQTGVQLQ
eukprot:TRINITY_DN15830_c0_g1_i4.p4 TRINITY_DN15830_c0_g1~~TRINITY_DN15830_c0_g1_i4.p4  ORF type:complete len:117 (+),score=18.50 TRINITY_DN15830_c0_g1_i4:117-467(+)